MPIGSVNNLPMDYKLVTVCGPDMYIPTCPCMGDKEACTAHCNSRILGIDTHVQLGIILHQTIIVEPHSPP